MDIKEQAAFYKMLCYRGISVTDFQDQTLVRKIFVPNDDRVYLRQNKDSSLFASLNEAESFLKEYIHWEYIDNTVIVEKEVVEEVKSNVIELTVMLMIDLGYGVPQETVLGSIGVDTELEDHNILIQNQSQALVDQYFAAEHPGVDPETFKTKVIIRPAN